MRPKNADSAETIARIVRSARKRFEDQGMVATSLKHIAEDAGVSVSAITLYFKNKDNLILECLREFYGEFTTRLPQHMQTLADGGDVKEGLHSLITEAVAVSRKHHADVRMLLRRILEEGDVPTMLQNHWPAAFGSVVAKAAQRPEVLTRFRFYMAMLMIGRVVTSPGETERNTGVKDQAEQDRMLVEACVTLILAPVTAVS